MKRQNHTSQHSCGFLDKKKHKTQTENCRGRLIFGKNRLEDEDQMEAECPSETKYSNCLKKHSAFSRTCTIYKRKEEIKRMKYRLLKARKIGCNVKVKTYDTVPQIGESNLQQQLGSK